MVFVRAKVALLLTMLTLACGTANVPPVDVATRDVRDDLGRTVKVPVKIDRAISLAPNVTEMVFAIGAGDRLVGVTTYCNYPPEATKIDKIGDTQTPNIEKILALKPQIVLVSTASQLEAFSRTLEEQGIAVYVTNPTSMETVFDNMSQLAEMFGTQSVYRDLAATSVSVVGAVIGRANDSKDKSRPRVFVQFSRDPLFTIGKGSFVTELVSTAGGDSVTKDLPDAYPNLSKEAAAAFDPDVIILSDSSDNRDPSDALKNSIAVRNGRVYRIDADILSRPGPRVVDALVRISEILHPDIKN